MPSIMSSGSAAGRDANGGTTAPVLEFVCLYTHDLKRKQKRWQDGRLKYHTFNSRVMVYDDRGNFVGDMHWNRDREFDEGEEVELERGGVIVQVAECVGQRTQDLSELVDKRAKEKEERQAKAAARSTVYGPNHRVSPLQRTPAPQDHFQTRHRPLHQVIGTPTGHHGRALVPNESPFEQRQRAMVRSGDGGDARPAKRRRQDDTPPSKMGYAQALFGAPLTLSAVPMSSAPLRRLTTARSQTRPQSSPPDPKQDEVERYPRASLSKQGPKEVDSTPTPNLEVMDKDASPRRSPSRDGTSRIQQMKMPASINGCGTSTHFRKPGISQIQARKNESSRLSMAITPQSELKTPNAGRSTINGLSAHQSTEGETPRHQEVVILDDDDDDDDDDSESAPEPQPKTRPKKKPAKEQNGRTQKHVSTSSSKSTETKLTERLPRLPSPPEQPVAKVVHPPAITPAVTNEPPQEKTEIRIKPRQKRGLLVALELPRKPKRAKSTKPSIQEDAAHTQESTAHTTSIAEPPVPPEVPGTKKLIIEDEDPFAWFPFEEEASIGDRSSERHPSRQPPTAKNRSSAPCEHGGTDINKDSRPTKKKPKPRQAAYDVPEDTDDEFGNARSHLSVHNDQDNSDGSQLEPESDGSSVDMSSSKTQTRAAARRTRGTTRKSGEKVQDTTQTKRTLPRADSSEEEFPQVPVGPRLARLSRKSVKSREVIGFILSSSPVAEHAHVPTLHRNNHPQVDLNSALGCSTSVSGPVSKLSTHSTSVSPSESIIRPCGFDDTINVEDTRSASAERQNTVVAAKATESGISAPQRRNLLPWDGHHEPTGDCIPPNLATDNDLSKDADHPHRAGLVPQRSAVIAISSGRIGDEQTGTITTGPGKAIRDVEQQRPDAGEHTVPNKEGKSAGDRNDVQQPLRGARGPPDLPDAQPKPKSTAHRLEQRSLVEGDGSGGTTAAQERATAAPKGPPPKIANPASRGRKAALKSDAAGQVPQNILPPPDPMPMRSNMRPVVPETRRDSAGNERPKRKMTFPGFVSARVGGPWSREAHDLLESGRPGST